MNEAQLESLKECRHEADELVKLGIWSRAEADAAVGYLRDNPEFLGLIPTEALDLARDLT